MGAVRGVLAICEVLGISTSNQHIDSKRVALGMCSKFQRIATNRSSNSNS